MTLFHWIVLVLVLLPLVLLMLPQKAPLMTIISSKNPGHLTHQECGGGAVTLTTDRAARKSIVTCAGCEVKAEFDPIYTTTSFRLTKEDGKKRSVPLRRYRDKPLKGRLHIIPAPPAH